MNNFRRNVRMSWGIILNNSNAKWSAWGTFRANRKSIPEILSKGMPNDNLWYLAHVSGEHRKQQLRLLCKSLTYPGQILGIS